MLQKTYGQPLLLVLCALFLGIISPQANAGPYTFTGLGDLPDGDFSSVASAVSADGLVVVGSGTTTRQREAFRWTRDGGMVGLGYLPGGYWSGATGLSSDGSVIVGQSTSDVRREAFRWTRDGGMEGLGDLPGGDYFSFAFDVSADGSVAVGRSETRSGINAFRWTRTGEMDGLQGLPNAAGGNPRYDSAYGVSADGSVVVGESLGRAVVWDGDGRIFDLGNLPGGSFSNLARDVSADGTTIVGYGVTDSGVEAFRWTDLTGIVRLGDLPGGDVRSIANAVSADGSVIVGSASTAEGTEPFYMYIQGGGYWMESLSDLLIENSVTGFHGWTLHDATGVSDDGGTIVGYGTNPDGDTEAWIATVPLFDGGSQSFPILPGSSANNSFIFLNAPSGAWFDPTPSDTFDFVMLSDDLFTSIDALPSFLSGPVTVSSDGNTIGQFNVGDSVDFVSLTGGGVSNFQISGISPLVDGDDPLAFPVQLSFDAPIASFSMTAVPEPSTLVFAFLALLALVGRGRRLTR